MAKRRRNRRCGRVRDQALAEALGVLQQAAQLAEGNVADELALTLAGRARPADIHGPTLAPRCYARRPGRLPLAHGTRILLDVNGWLVGHAPTLKQPGNGGAATWPAPTSSQTSSQAPQNAKRPASTGRNEYRYRDSNPGFRHERAAS